MWLLSEELMAVDIPLNGQSTTLFVAENDAAAFKTDVLSRTILSVFYPCSLLPQESKKRR